MKAGDLKKLISKIPDNDDICFFYEINTIDCQHPETLHHNQIKEFYEDIGIEYDDVVNEKYFGCGKHDWLLVLDD